jgi:cytochrome c oxidase subunit II
MVGPPRRTRSPRSGRLAPLARLGGLALVLSACSLVEVDSPLTTWDPAGPFAEQIDELFWPVFWVAVGVFVAVQGAILVAVFMFRDRPGRKEPRQVHGNAVLEVTWTVIPALILAVVAVPTVQAVFDLTECGADAQVVEITGHQWWFEFHYPDHDITTANVLVMPVDQEICAVMTSADVMHNFWLPHLNGKRYLIPGQETLLRLESDAVGEYWGQCGEFCGLSHALMRTRAQVLTAADFDQWVADQQTPATAPAEGTPEFEGLSVFVSKGCTACHNVEFSDEDRAALEEAGVAVAPLADEAFNGPDLTHFASRDVFAGAALPDEGTDYEEALAAWIENPPAIKPGSYMPDLGLTAQEIDQVITWLRSNE